jgi:galactose-1-phosphate uridylyltransferase
MVPSHASYVTLPDGTLKHIHPITGTEVWTVPSRAARPFVNRQHVVPKPLPSREKEDFCDFCEAHYLKTPPEKSRLIQTGEDKFQTFEHLSPDSVKFTKAAFRRLENLFEIVTFDYWVKNHQVALSPSQALWKKEYLENPQGLLHVQDLMRVKLKLGGRSSTDIESLIAAPPQGFFDSFFGGTHEVLATGHHFRPGATHDNQLFSSGEMTQAEHAAFLGFAAQAALDIQTNNPKVLYVAIFQNWLRAAGASFDHLHKQVVGMDEWGPVVEKRLQRSTEDPGLFNESIVDFAAKAGLLVAENDHAIALSEFGHPYPTLAVYSKSKTLRPWEQSPEEVRAMSDLLHACHRAAGPDIPCNEIWFYTPAKATTPFPWHILIQWRTVTAAGFEADTQIFVNPVPPLAFKEQLVERLLNLKSEGKITDIRIGQEINHKPNSLLYNR